MAYQDFNMEHHWLPFTPNRSFKKDPRILVAADGVHFTTHDGRQVLDGISSLWCVGAGHNRKLSKVIAAYQDTLNRFRSFNIQNIFKYPATE